MCGSSQPAGVNHTDIKAGGNLNKEDTGLLGSGMHVPWAESWFTRCTGLSLLHCEFRVSRPSQTADTEHSRAACCEGTLFQH